MTELPGASTRVAAVAQTREQREPKRTKKDFHPQRVKGRKRAAEICAEAQDAVHASGHGDVTDRKLAKRWGLGKSGHKSIANLFDPDTGKAITLGDVMALPPKLARAILIRAYAAVGEAENVSARQTISDLVIETGKATERLEADYRPDGIEDQHRLHADSFARVADVAIRGHLASDRRAREQG